MPAWFTPGVLVVIPGMTMRTAAAGAAAQRSGQRCREWPPSERTTRGDHSRAPDENRRMMTMPIAAIVHYASGRSS